MRHPQDEAEVAERVVFGEPVRRALAEDFPSEWSVDVVAGYAPYESGYVVVLRAGVGECNEVAREPLLGIESLKYQREFDNAVVDLANKMWRETKRAYEIDKWTKARGWEK